MSVIEGLLARIKARFEPGRPAPANQAAEEPPPQRTEPAFQAPAPAIAPPPAEEAGAGAAPPALVARAPTPVAEAPARVAEASTATPVPTNAEASIAIAEAPTAVEEEPAGAPAPSGAPAPEAEEAPAGEPTVAVAPSGGLTLRLETERGPQSTFEVTKSGATIGRGPESTIQLADLSVSRKHAKITYKQGAYWLSDLGSMGGTWIDGTKLAAPHRVATGQTIDIGLCRLTVVTATDAEKSGAAKGPSNAA